MPSTTTSGASRSRWELAARTERDRASLEQAVGQLERALRKELSIGDRLAERPLPWLTGAFAFGIFMGLH